MLQELQPIFTNELLRDCDEQLYQLLLAVEPNDWTRIAAYEEWTVKDVFSHLVDVTTRRLSLGRDELNLPPDTPITSYDGLVGFIDRLADEWVTVTRRISPRVLLTLFKTLKSELYDYFISCDPFGEGIPVAWAGENHSANWFDQAREYTEHWIHQQQIRASLSLPPIRRREHWKAVMDVSIRCLPTAYQNIIFPEGTALGIMVTGEVSRDYCLVREASNWKLYSGKDERANARCAFIASELCFGLTGLTDMKFSSDGNAEFFAPLKAARAFMTNV